jgi:hypothetical protein
MAIPDIKRQAFEELRRAFKNGDVALLECEDTATSHPVYVICAVNAVHDGDDGVEFQYIPFGSLDGTLIQRVSNPIDSHHSTGGDA